MADRYADRPMVRREQLTRLFLRTCAALAAHALEERRYDDAVGWAMRSLEESRCDEHAYRCLIEANARAGRSGEALRQYRRCEAALREALGVEPAPETTQLLRALLRDQVGRELDAA